MYNSQDIKNLLQSVIYPGFKKDIVSFDFVKDKGAMPDELAELSELSRLIREAISILPQKERTVVEYRFYRSMQVKEIAKAMGLSSSRITRIVQFSLNHIREYLQKRDLTEY